MSAGDFREELRKLIREELGTKKILEGADQPKENYTDHVCECSGIDGCYCDILKKARATFDYQCSNCGLPLSSKFIQEARAKNDPNMSCPNCRSTNAKAVPIMRAKRP